MPSADTATGGPARTSSRSGASTSGLTHVVRQASPAVVVVVLLVGLLPLATRSALLASAAVVATGLVILLLSLGLERTAVVLLVLGFVLAPMDALRPVGAVAFASASDLCLLAAIGLLVPILISRPFPVHAAFLLGAAGVVAAGLVTSVLASDPAGSLNSLLRLVVGALVLPLVFMAWRPGRVHAVAFAGAYVAGNALNVVYARVDGTANFEGRYAGLSTHVNVLGLCAMLGVALVPFLLASVPRQYCWLVLLGGASSAYGVWISGSRAALLVAVAVAVLYPLLARSLGLGLGLVGLAIAPLYLVGETIANDDVSDNALGRLLGGGSASASDLAREQVAAQAVAQFEAHPILGGGFAGVLEAHNIYFQLAAAGGIIGTAFYLILLGSVVREPFVLGGRAILLALPALGYVMIGFMTTLLWDRYIWCVLALPFLMLAAKDQDESAPADAVTTQESR